QAEHRLAARGQANQGGTQEIARTNVVMDGCVAQPGDGRPGDLETIPAVCTRHRGKSAVNRAYFVGNNRRGEGAERWQIVDDTNYQATAGGSRAVRDADAEVVALRSSQVGGRAGQLILISGDANQRIVASDRQGTVGAGE